MTDNAPTALQRLMDCIFIGDTERLEAELRAPIKEKYVNQALCVAVQERQVRCVEILLNVTSSVPHQAFLESIRANSKACFELLLPYFSLNDQYALCFAAQLGRLEQLKLFAPHCDVTHKNSEALWKSAERGHVSCVGFLLPLSDPRDYPNALSWALRNGKRDCVEILRPHIENPQEVVDDLNTTRGVTPRERANWEWFEAELLKERLAAEITPAPLAAVKKM